MVLAPVYFAWFPNYPSLVGAIPFDNYFAHSLPLPVIIEETKANENLTPYITIKSVRVEVS